MIVGVNLAVLFAAVIADCLSCAVSLASCVLGECLAADIAIVVFRAFVIMTKGGNGAAECTAGIHT